ncbi:lysine-2,3-aminomutase-like protein [Acetobacter sp.]|jgi:lysine 2,3-aminomutase|uniref:lysine-2,3-aminomutase-like protein n=1 Tax=Acetobacter sp. TaxID=440 RepID=UPI0025C287EE|nr:lysine-2,3-aminomutase-like protein [Acetobacter sp.]MCH4090278.1 lysine-2,3-aminomutase-like protein [Acetobacter sp.]MCI1298972.1 lysine-2,3-aminomutase-like protein [Acetobacter sp.]MCI1314992.1 lysine-2,3-aminomutase-like protein [Acetobacter sp.]
MSSSASPIARHGTHLSTAGTLRSPEELVGAGLVGHEQLPAIARVAEQYATAIPPAFLKLIETPDDPIGVQVIPSPNELHTAPHELADPIGDDALSPVPGIVHRYADRALLKPLLICPLYCRFCFRREHVGPDGGLLDEAALETAFNWLRENTAIREVILTGGDPLMLSPRRLGHIMSELAAIPHVTTLRIHSRVPLAAPEKITEALLDAMDADKAVWLVVHANHAREFSLAGREALKRILRRGIPVLGQSVLLRGVNDSENALEGLFRAMVESRMKPYYLHQLDPAPGTARFHVPIEEGRRLLAGLRGRVTGLAWPTYVLDIPGGYGKVPLGPDYLEPSLVEVSDPNGHRHAIRTPDSL